MTRTLPTRLVSAGFSLVEVTLALGIAAFCLTALLGLLPIGLNSNQTAISQTAAASIARSIVTDLRNTPFTTPPTDQTSPNYQIPVPVTKGAVHTLYFSEDGMLTVNVDTNAAPSPNSPYFSPRYRATLSFTPPVLNSAGFYQRNATTVRVLVTWPAAADPMWASAPARFSGSYEAQITLNRN